MSDNNLSSLSNHFLLAMPELGDTLFYRSVIYICEHSEEGAMGIIINRPLDIYLGVILEKMSLPSGNKSTQKKPVYLGGPLQTQRGFVLHTGGPRWEDTIIIHDELCITSSKDILESMSHGDGPRECLVALGYSGWGPGQLEEEIRDNVWLNVPADHEILFSTDVDKRWNKALSSMGIDETYLSNQVGHA